MVPDIFRGGMFFLSETRVEEISIFLLGVIAIIVFIKKEQIISFHRKQKEKDKKKIDQAVKDLVESYSYIGEVNRKMDLLINIALGLTDRSVLNKAKEKEIYQSIISAASFLFKADFSTIRFVDFKFLKTKKEISSDKGSRVIKNTDLLNSNRNISVKKYEDCLIISSNREINNIKSFIIVCGYDKEEKDNPKNIEILKVFASQALFLYSYIQNTAAIAKNGNDKEK